MMQVMNTIFWPGLKKTGENQPAENYDEVYEIFSSCAGAAMYNKAILEKIGLLMKISLHIWKMLI